MKAIDLIAALSSPEAYPFPVTAVEVRQTHISAVFLAGSFAYKIKKPVNLGFLDFSTLEKRRHFCAEEVRLNRRLAPEVYLNVVPIVIRNGRSAVEAPGEVIEWAVKMVRLPEEATLEQRLVRGEVEPGSIAALAEVVAGFHARAERSAHIAGFGHFNGVAGNARENFEQAAPEVGRTIHPTVFARLRTLTEDTLTRLRTLIEARAERGVPCDTHGDLHLDHVYSFPERRSPDDLTIIDCIEFNERFRYGDPVGDMAFLVMDLKFHGWRDLAQTFADAYFRSSGDDQGRALLPFYTAYRAAVRGKVEGFELREREIPEAGKAAAQNRAKAHWLLALGELEAPVHKPCLLLVGGLPGTGKSTLARGLAESGNGIVLRSDVIRKELAGLDPTARQGAQFNAGLYTTEWTERTYAECLRRAETLLFEGRRVIVDATFREESQREAFLRMAQRWAVSALWFDCRCDADAVRRRLSERRGDASDADWNVYQIAANRWQPAGKFTSQALRKINTGLTANRAVQQALDILRERELT